MADEDGRDWHGGQPRESLAKLLMPRNRGGVLDRKRQCAVLLKLDRDQLGWAFHLARNFLPLDYDTADRADLPPWRGRSDRADSEQSNSHLTAVYRTTVDTLVQHAAIPKRTIYAVVEAVEGLPEAEAARVWQSIAA